MVLPPEIAGAAVECDIETLQRFLDQHPERVNDVDDGFGDGRARGSVHVDVRAPDALAEVLPRPAEGALAATVTRCAWTGEGKAASPLDLRVGDAARILAPLRAVVSERAVLESDGVLEPSLLSSNL